MLWKINRLIFPKMAERSNNYNTGTLVTSIESVIIIDLSKIPWKRKPIDERIFTRGEDTKSLIPGVSGADDWLDLAWSKKNNEKVRA